MPEVEDFDELPVFANLIVNQDWTVQQLTYARTFSDLATHARIAGQQFHVIEQGITETRSRLIVVFGDMANDLSEIF